MKKEVPAHLDITPAQVLERFKAIEAALKVTAPNGSATQVYLKTLMELWMRYGSAHHLSEVIGAFTDENFVAYSKQVESMGYDLQGSVTAGNSFLSKIMNEDFENLTSQND